jgi:hypothetical protein
MWQHVRDTPEHGSGRYGSVPETPQLQWRKLGIVEERRAKLKHLGLRANAILGTLDARNGRIERLLKKVGR